MGSFVLIYAKIPAMTNLLTELKRRNVFRVAIAYLVLGWIVLQVGETLAPALHLPEWVDSLLAFFVILGFPLASSIHTTIRRNNQNPSDHSKDQKGVGGAKR